MVRFDDNMERVRRKSMLLMLRGRASLQAFKSWCRSRPIIAAIVASGLLLSIVMSSIVTGRRQVDPESRQRSLQDVHDPTRTVQAAQTVHQPPSGNQARHCIREMGAIHSCVNHRHSNCTAVKYWQCLRQHGFADGQYTALVRYSADRSIPS